MTQVNSNSGTKRVAILIENGVEDAEFKIPYTALKMAGIETVVLGSRTNETYKGKQGKVSQSADGTTTEAMASEFDAVIIPGGMAPDKMRVNPNTVRFVQEAMQQGKLVAAVCHGPQVLIEGDLLQGKQATGFIAIRKDMINAGANYSDEPLVIDGNLITSRQPGDLAIFTTAILSRLGYGGKEAALPDVGDTNAEWWKLADAWGGSTKGEIVKGLNTALAGEKYAHEEFEQYANKASDPQIKGVFQEIVANKQQHIQQLEARLAALGEKPSLTANAADKYAKVKTALQGSDENALLRRALGDIQTGVVDAHNLFAQFTDPVTTALFKQIEQDGAKCERYLADLYRSRAGTATKPGKPTTGAAVTM
jgi:protease I